MSLKSEPFYWLECDKCGQEQPDDCGGSSRWGDGRYAEDEAIDQDWHVEGGNHLCWDCTPPDRDDEDVTP